MTFSIIEHREKIHYCRESFVLARENAEVLSSLIHVDTLYSLA